MEAQQYKKLWWDIILATLSFAVVPLFILGGVIYHQFSVSYTAKIKDNMKTLAENRAGSVDLFLDERISQLTGLAHTHSLEQLKDEDYLNKVFNIIQTRSKSFLDLGVIDEEGNHLAYVGPYYNLLKKVNYHGEKWFHEVMATGVYVSDVFLGFRKIPHFIIAVMVREKKKIWILRATIDSDIIDNIVRAAWIDKKGDAFLVNRENILQTTPRFGGKVMEPPKAPDFAAATGTSVEELDFRGETLLYATSIIKLKKWVLVIREDPTEQLTPLLQARFLAVLISLGGVVLIIIGAYFTTRAMMKELMRMEQKKAASDEVAMQSSKMAALGKMAAGIAHEINNPLAVIGEKAGWMKDLLGMEDMDGSENFQELLDAVNKIEYHVVRAKTVTHRLLGFARRMEPLTERVNINTVLDESIDFLENEARYRNIDIQTNYAPDLPLTTTDQSQLQQVFLNIINNAIDAIGKEGEININTRPIKQTNRISIEISDNGPGMPKEVLQKIFDPFFTTKEVGKGTGLGLSISYSIIEKLGGKIMVASEEGQGTTFTIYLPVR
ncbi:MAG: ATP-binding protein [Proteobacteria bacterium]|nr:ATP-binding protein [Pseudomonadota bacterium]MBU4448779.1 ATP-binding protein [Pseudomonadota bacterium]MCG2773501.1 ATP-binding protein [Desulfobacterales bacterium]